MIKAQRYASTNDGKWQRMRAVAYMGAANSLHYAGYELARSGILALFTSHRSGFESASSSSFATGCVSPFAMGLLWVFSRMFDRTGPRTSLWLVTCFVALQLAAASIVLQLIDPRLETSSMHRMLSKAILFVLFVSQHAFVQLLSSQHWSFLSSILLEDQAAVWFAPIAGFGSLVSTIIAWRFLPMVDQIGLTGLIMLASALLFGCALCSDTAYEIASKHGFSPSSEDASRTVKNYSQNESNHNSNNKESLFARARRIFRSSPILLALCIEVLFCQCQSSLLSYLFVLSTKTIMPKDDDRARFTGSFYSWINLSSGILQFALLPFIFQSVDRTYLWLVLPLTIMASSAWTLWHGQADFYIVAASFGVFKTLEYSLRGAITEMIYVSMDYESRFLGKEIVGLVANRVGKSATAIGLAIITLGVDPGVFRCVTPFLLCIISCLWLFASYRLVICLNKNKVE